MVQRMGLGTLLVHEPELLLLDEPASGLDPMARIQLRDILRKLAQEGKTVVISSHILTELSGFCTHLAIMNCGRLVMYGSVEEIEQRIAGQRSFVVRVLGSVEAAEATIRSIGDVEVIGTGNHTFTLVSNKGQEAIAEVNRRLVTAGIPVVELRQQATSLEELFVKLSATENLQIS